MTLAHFHIFATDLGACGIAWTRDGIIRVQLPEKDAAATEARLRARSHHAVAGEPSRDAAIAIAHLREYFSGKAVSFDALAIALPSVSDFQASVYKNTRALAWGRTASYGEIAKLSGDLNAARAVGVAMSQNPMPIIIPCHRVLAAGQQIGGFSAYGGAVTKQKLLAMEGIHLDGGQPTLPGL